MKDDHRHLLPARAKLAGVLGGPQHHRLRFHSLVGTGLILRERINSWLDKHETALLADISIIPHPSGGIMAMLFYYEPMPAGA